MKNSSIFKFFLFGGVIVLLLSGCEKKRGVASHKITGSSPSSTGEIPNTLTVTRFSGTYTITGIATKKDCLVAIINGKMLREGAELDPGVVLSEVHPSYVVITFGNSRYIIKPSKSR